ncbi:calcium-binding protein [Teichococcus vastitatis]|uniref:Calcium-binding protein n=1 Tax=Teichococcus vastitatis TaxID=2307076 RepID=A0ABS9WBK4_9PROT|nr:hypothetical protein [Pseudoroseomonas vastitatis]MCI0756135.1 hypothetical protein [Pseudoroseomonas vastitatis]
MTSSCFGGGSLLPSLPWLPGIGVEPIIGTAGADDRQVNGSLRLVFGWGGDDTITAEALPGGIWGNVLFGGWGNDTLTALGDRNLVFGEAGNDIVTLRGPLIPEGGVEEGLLNIAFGGVGDDIITSYGFAATLRGGTGNDTLELDGFDGTGGYAYGDEGDDDLSNVTDGGVLDGDAGADIFYGANFAFSPTIGTGTVMTGGSGPDDLRFFGGSPYAVEEDTDNRLGVGDAVAGLIGVVTDLQAEDGLFVGNGLLPADLFEGEVPLEQGDSSYNPGLQAILPQGRYVALSGELISPGRFYIEEDGPDRLLLFVQRYIGEPGGEGPDFQAATGAVALLDYTDSAIPLADPFIVT